jgi:hypothetical protein
MKKKSSHTPRHSTSAHKFSRKNDIFCDLYRKDNFRCSKMTSHQTFIRLFYLAHKKWFFPQNFVYGHNMSRYKPKIFFSTF